MFIHQVQVARPLPPLVWRQGGLRALGASTPFNQMSTSQLASTAVTTATSLTAAILPLAGIAGPAAPIVAAIGLALGPIIGMFSGCGQTCIQATQYANQADAAVAQAFNVYMAAPVHYKSAQQAFLSQFQQLYQYLYNACSSPQLGSAGQRCISERLVRGGTAPWCPTSTGCDWFTQFYDPVANDPHVVDDTAGSTGLLSGTGGSGSLLPLLLLVVAGIVLVNL